MKQNIADLLQEMFIVLLTVSIILWLLKDTNYYISLFLAKVLPITILFLIFNVAIVLYEKYSIGINNYVKHFFETLFHIHFFRKYTLSIVTSSRIGWANHIITPIYMLRTFLISIPKLLANILNVGFNAISYELKTTFLPVIYYEENVNYEEDVNITRIIGIIRPSLRSLIKIFRRLYTHVLSDFKSIGVLELLFQFSIIIFLFLLIADHFRDLSFLNKSFILIFILGLIARLYSFLHNEELGILDKSK